MLIAWVVLALISCGGGGGGGGSSSAGLNSGVFIDSPVEGLIYSTETQFGITDSQGRFLYRDGETVAFFIEDVALGEAPANDKVTLLDILEGAEAVTDWRVTNIARLLQSLDLDGIPENGITLTLVITGEVAGRTLDFNLSPEEFENSSEVLDIFDALNDQGVFPDGEVRTLCSAEDAQSHLLNSLEGADLDNDGFTIEEGDVDDRDPNINPQTGEESSSDDSATSEPDTSEPRSDGSLAVFPGAEGFGSGTVAGRGGQIIRVTNLNDSGSGSFRAAATASGARIVVFEVGGTINLNSVVLIRNPYLTIAGQTAPEPGIQLRNYGIEIDTHDVLVQHLRIRAESGEGDGLRIHGYQNETYKVVVDHVTSNWASDENMSIWGASSGRGVHDVTLSNCIIAEGGKGILIGSDSSTADHIDNISVIDNLFAHNTERNPRLKNNTNAQVVNNLAYNTGSWEFTAIGGPDGPTNASFIGNHYIGGPNGGGASVIGLSSSAPPGNYYVNDCLVTGIRVGSLMNSTLQNHLVSTPPVRDINTVARPVDDVRDYVLDHAGARPSFRDSVEERIVYEVMTETGSIKTSSSAAGGYPSAYNSSTRSTFFAGSNPNGDDDGDGYTNVEEILHQMAAEVEGR